MADKSVDRKSFSGENHTELKLCISCGPVTLLEATGEDGLSTAYGS